MVLGDNNFCGNGFGLLLRTAVRDAEEKGRATAFGYYVPEPERFGKTAVYMALFGGYDQISVPVIQPGNSKTDHVINGRERQWKG